MFRGLEFSSSTRHRLAGVIGNLLLVNGLMV
jgi:hypothetical protein